MITAGIDMGAKTIKVVLLEDGKKVRARAMEFGGTDTRAATEKAFNAALFQAGLKMADMGHITATGAGRASAPYASDVVTEVGAGARGAGFLHPPPAPARSWSPWRGPWRSGSRSSAPSRSSRATPYP